jgi:purine catabolism regulator
VVLHQRVRFVEVTEEVHRGIVAEQLEQVELAREVHETFTRLSLEGADAATIVATTASLGGSSVVLEDLGRHVVAFTALGRPAASLLTDWERRSRAVPSADATGVTGPEGWVTAAVGTHGRRWGRLVVPDPQTAQSRLAMILERAAQALELGRMVERDRLGLELQAQGGLLTDLATGRVRDSRTAAARAESLGLRPARRYVGVVAVRRAVTHAGPSPAGPSASTRSDADPVAEHDRSRELVERLSRALRTTGLSGLVGALPGPGGPGSQVGLLLAVPLGSRREPEDAAVLDALADAVAGEALLGVGPVASSVLDAGHGLRLAAHVAEVASAMPGGAERSYHRSSDVRLHGLLALLHEDPRVQAYVEGELGPLLEHEARTGSGLLDLLRQHVAAGGNKTRLAESSHRSRPAVYKKLAQIERLLGVDLDDPLSLMSVGVALMAYDQGSAGGP